MNINIPKSKMKNRKRLRFWRRRDVLTASEELSGNGISFGYLEGTSRSLLQFQGQYCLELLLFKSPALGTCRTWLIWLTMSAPEGKSDLAGTSADFRN
jgi:hypothetical protein